MLKHQRYKHCFPQLYDLAEIEELRALTARGLMKSHTDEDTGATVYDNYSFVPVESDARKDINYDKLVKKDSIMREIRKRNEKGPEWFYAQQLGEMLIPKKCAVCQAQYTEIDNFNKSCFFHPGVETFNTIGETIMSCCKKAPLQGKGNYVGCKPCDHTTFKVKWTRETDTEERIPCYFVDNGFIKLPKSCIKSRVDIEEDPLRSYYLISRY